MMPIHVTESGLVVVTNSDNPFDTPASDEYRALLNERLIELNKPPGSKEKDNQIQVVEQLLRELDAAIPPPPEELSHKTESGLLIPPPESKFGFT